MMDLAPALITLLLILTVLWIILVYKGVDPWRLLTGVFKSPRHYLTPSSYAERERLLADSKRAPAGPRTGQTIMYSDSVARLMECTETSEIEEIIQFIYATRLVNSDIKAQHFAQYCQRKLPLHTLSPATLAVIIKMLHRYVKFQGVAECVQSCFHVTTGIDCVHLKNELERHLSIYRLVYQHIRFSCVRIAIVEHLEREAAEVLNSPDFVQPVKLICDIDDTMISVLFDTRYPDLTVYPGVHQFVEEVLQSSDDSGAGVRSRMTFLTARPEIMRRRSIHQLRASGFFHFNLLMGRLSDAVLGPRRISAGKLENFENFRRLFSEHRFVFVGDNGQGDIDLGMDLLRQPEKYGISMVLIHDVIRNHVRSANRLTKAGILIESYRRRECEESGIHLFQTYISAVARLYAHGMVDAGAVLRVIQKTTAAHASIKYESTAQRESSTREIAGDIMLVLASLPEIHIESILSDLSTELKEQIQKTHSLTDASDLPV